MLSNVPGPRPGLRPASLCLLALLLTSAGCPAEDPRPPRPSTDAGTAAPDAAPEPAKPPPLPFEVEDDILDVVAAWSVPTAGGGTEGLEELERTARPWAVPLTGSLRVELWQRLTDFRVRLLDGNGRPLANEALVGQVPTRERGGEVSPGGTWIQVHPRDGFPPSTPIRVVLDGENGPYALDIKGKAYQDLVLDVVGDTPPATMEETDGGTRPIGTEDLP